MESSILDKYFSAQSGPISLAFPPLIHRARCEKMLGGKEGERGGVHRVVSITEADTNYEAVRLGHLNYSCHLMRSLRITRSPNDSTTS